MSGYIWILSNVAPAVRFFCMCADVPTQMKSMPECLYRSFCEKSFKIIRCAFSVLVGAHLLSHKKVNEIGKTPMSIVRAYVWPSYQAMIFNAADRHHLRCKFLISNFKKIFMSVSIVGKSKYGQTLAHRIPVRKSASQHSSADFHVVTRIFDEVFWGSFQSYVTARKSPGFGNYHALIRQENRAALIHWLLTVGSFFRI